MKKTIYQLQHLMQVCLKSIAAIILLSVFTASFGQVKDPPGFDATKERQKAVAKGVHGDEIESFVNMQRSYYEFLKEAKEKGSYRKIIPPLTSSFTRKSSIPDCPGTFENGTVSPWSGYKSINNSSGLDSFVNDQKGFTSGGVQTVVTTGFDGVITTLPKVRSGGGNYSLKVGDNNNGGEVDMAARTVTATGTCISFWYALVFERPANHPDPQTQPFFIFRVRDSYSNIIASFVKSSSLDTTYFTKKDSSGSVVYRGWTQQTLNLGCEYIGKDVTIEVIVSDCSWGGHYGYAYVDDVCFEDCMNCCKTCEDVINMPELYNSHPVIVYKGSTADECCYALNLPLLVAMPFKCSVYGLKIYEEGNPGSPFSSYQDTQDIQTSWFDQRIMDFCIHRDSFTTPKTIVLALYDFNGNLICDSIKRVIEPCYTSTGCNCDNLFSNPNFAQTTTIKKDTIASTEGNCCFTFTPFRDSSTIKCPYYGFRVYKDSMAWSPSFTYLDTLNPTTPLGGAGAGTSTDTFKFCLGSYMFDSLPVPIRIEYLDSTGKVICSKVESVSCEETCCENISYFIKKDTTETDPTKCCYRIEVWAFACNKTYTAELMKDTGGGWATAGMDTFSVSRPIFFDVCSNNGDTVRYMVFIKDSAGNVLCTKEIIQSCPNCCDVIGYTATYVAPPFGFDRCCWDINIIPAATQDCNILYWQVYDSLHQVQPTYSLFFPPSPIYQGRHCTGIINPVNPAPGTSVTLTYCIDRYLAVYDNNRRLLCIKTIHLCCTRTYTNSEGPCPTCPPYQLQVAPNPFNETFTMSMDLPQEMPVAINVINSTGSVVFTKNYGQQPQGVFTQGINLAGQPAGIYMLSVNNGQATIQIVKQ